MSAQGEWSRISQAVIAAVDERLPADASLRERKAALRAAYPFGVRKNWPYRVWLKAQRAYLSHYSAHGPTAGLARHDSTARGPLFEWRGP